MNLNIDKELEILENNFTNQVNQSLGKELYVKDSTFQKNNWLITFPFNFMFTDKNISIEIVRKIAIINAFYGVFFLKEDDVLDDYNQQPYEYKNCLIKMCGAHNYSNLAKGQLLYLCGIDIYDYIFKYEKLYYDAIIFEKTNDKTTLKNIFNFENLHYLGYKLIPLCVSFTAFCLLENYKDKISICEKMITNYHIAYQLYDDIFDIKKDIKEPDLSYTLTAIKNHLKQKNLTLSNVEFVFNTTKIFKQILVNIEHYLKLSKKYAEQLNFKYFLAQILHIEKSVKILKQKYSNNIQMLF